MKDIGHRLAPPRFTVFLIVFAIGLAIGIPALDLPRGVMAAFDVASALFLVLISTVFRRGEAAQMRQASRDNDANRTLLLGFVAINGLVVLVTVGAAVKDAADPLAIGLVIATLCLAWLFSTIIYALHYAHLYYRSDDDGDCGGLEFKDDDEPDYWDFLYFAATLGMAFATSDVKITSKRFRRIALGQCLVAFVFNLGVIAFAVGALGGA